MESLENAYRIKRAGRFSDALVALDQANNPPALHIASAVLRAELLEAIGQKESAKALATSLLQSRRLRPLDKSACEYVLGAILMDEGDVIRAMDHLQSAAEHARSVKAFDRVITPLLKLMLAVAERSGPGASASLLAEARQIATRLGDSHVTAKLHLFVAEMEAKRGLFTNARRHLRIAHRLLANSPNAFLDAFCSNLELAISLLLGQFGDAQLFATRATELAQRSGVAKIQRAVLGNIGNLFFELGKMDRAMEHFEHALVNVPSGGPHTTASLDNLARIHLVEGRFDLCRASLDRIEASIRDEHDRQSHAHRYSSLTAIHLFAREGHVEDALSRTTALLELAVRTGDTLFQKQVQLTKAEDRKSVV